MTAYVDPMCSTCGGRGYYYTDEGETACAGCRLAERYQTRYCDSCDRPIDDMVFVRGELTHTEYAICADCLEASKVAHEDSIESQYRDAYGDDFDKLATHQVEGR